MSKRYKRTKTSMALGFISAALVMLILLRNTYTRWQRTVAFPIHGAASLPSFTQITLNNEIVSDKVVHGYGQVYDVYFNGKIQQESIKMLEIGLGCDMDHGIGASSLIWPRLFSRGQIWFAEIDDVCLEKYWKPNLPWKYVVGDQEDSKVLQSWLDTTGGNFDFIIDDGGHSNAQIWASFVFLFNHALKDGGVYFIEDLHVGRHDPFYGTGVDGTDGAPVIEVLSNWLDQLVVKSADGIVYAGHDFNPRFKGNLTNLWKLEIFPSISRIDCIQDMCAITKGKKVP